MGSCKTGNCKTKTMQTDLCTFKYKQAYPGIIQAYSGIFRILRNPGVFGTLTYSEPEAYSKP